MAAVNKTNTSDKKYSKDFTAAHFGFPRHWNETVVMYSDGSRYAGHLTRDGQRTGLGVYYSPVTLYGQVSENPNSILHWMEFTGLWENDLPTNGTYERVCGDGKRSVVYEGGWQDGVPFEAISERMVGGVA
jgi:hypothetical protein